jgi:SAM-dependent methyltransferase
MTETATPATPDTTHDWRDAGEGWGRRAAEWSCLYEHYAVDVLMAVFPRLGIGAGMRVLDVACGSGLAVRLASGAGATVAGIDASEPLIEIARARTPEADLRVGSMFELPWGDESFDAVTAINGIWGGCDDALREAHRVLTPGGRLALTFWGRDRPLDLKACFRIFARESPDVHAGSMRRLNDIAADGVVEEMLASTGFTLVESGARISVIEWPDADVAWRALSSLGPATPALRRHGDGLRDEVLAVIDECRDERGIYRFRNNHRFVIARKEI